MQCEWMVFGPLHMWQMMLERMVCGGEGEGKGLVGGWGGNSFTSNYVISSFIITLFSHVFYL